MASKNVVEIILSAKDRASDITRRALETVRSSAQRAIETITRVSAVAGTAFTALYGVAAKTGIQFNASMEQYQNTLEVVLKDQKKAVEMLKWATDFAKNTPFELPGIVEATVKLEAYGLKAKEMLPSIGDMAAVMGKDIIQAVEAVADAQTGELERLKEFGITKNMIIQQAKEMGMQSIVNAKGQITDIAKFNEALLALMEERFSGGMKKQAETFNGLMSNLKDGINIFMGQAMEPAFNKIKEWLPVAIDYMTRLNDTFKSGGWEGVMKEFLPPSVVSSITSGIDSINQAIDGFKEKIGIVTDGFKNLKDKVEKQDWSGIGTGIATGILTSLESISEFAPKFMEWIYNQLSSINWAELGVKVAKPALEFVVGFIGTLLDPSFWMENWQTMLTAALIVLPVGKILKIPGIKQIADYVWSFIKPAGEWVMKSGLQLFSDIGGSIFGGFLKSLGIKGGELLPKLRGIVHSAIEGIKDLGETIYLKGLYLMEKLGSGIAYLGPKQVVEATQKLIAKIDEKLSGFVNKAIEIGRNIVEGLAKGLGNSISIAVEKAKEVAQSVSGAVKSFFGIQSPSKLMAEYGKYIAEGFAKGMEDHKDKPISKALLMAEAIVEAVSKSMNAINLDLELSKAEFELWSTQVKETAISAVEKFKAEMEFLDIQLQSSKDKISLLDTAYKDMAKQKGINAEETKKLYIELLQEQKAYEEIAQSIANAKKEAAEYNQIVVGGDSIYRRNENGDLVQIGEVGIPKESKEERKKRYTGGWDPEDHRDTHVGGFKDMPRYAKGTKNHPGGLAIVGEVGPEIANLPSGTSVTPNNQLDKLFSIDYERLGRVIGEQLTHALSKFNNATPVTIDVYGNTFKDGYEAGEKLKDALRRVGL